MSKESLQEYFKRYMVDIRGRSMSTYKHYLDALNNISRNLKSKGLIKDNIYEIDNLDVLEQYRQILMADEEFVALNKRGNHMYTAGLQNYMTFAKGMNFSALKEEVEKFDVPVPKTEKVVVEREAYKRSNIVRVQAIELANHQCEIDNCHITFESAKDGNPYMEGHHAIPISKQSEFDCSLDVYANVICLCPLCHRRLHYGVFNDKETMLSKLYLSRRERLLHSGFDINKDDFIRLATSR